MDIRERIRTLRGALRLTQKQLADKLGISVSAVKKYESGTAPGADVLEKFARLGVNLNWLLLGDGDVLIELQNQSAEVTEVHSYAPARAGSFPNGRVEPTDSKKASEAVQVLIAAGITDVTQLVKAALIAVELIHATGSSLPHQLSERDQSAAEPLSTSNADEDPEQPQPRKFTREDFLIAEISPEPENSNKSNSYNKKPQSKRG